MGDLEKRVLNELAKPKDNKERHTFTLSASTKRGLAAWCKEHGLKESPSIEVMIRQIVPKKFFE